MVFYHIFKCLTQAYVITDSTGSLPQNPPSSRYCILCFQSPLPFRLPLTSGRLCKETSDIHSPPSQTYKTSRLICHTLPVLTPKKKKKTVSVVSRPSVSDTNPTKPMHRKVGSFKDLIRDSSHVYPYRRIGICLSKTSESSVWQCSLYCVHYETCDKRNLARDRMTSYAVDCLDCVHCRKCKRTRLTMRY